MTIDTSSINFFYEINKKENNDSSNKIRETILYRLLSNEIPKEWFIIDKRWNELKVELFKVIETDVYKIELKGGRSNSYDFLLRNGNDLLKLELKYNADRIDKCPQFLNISAINFIKGEDYASYYYDNYLKAIAKLANIEIPEKEIYMKYIYNSNYDKHPFFRNLYNKDKDIEKEKKKIVDESIKTYLNEIIELDIDEINKTFIEKEKDKLYLLYKKGRFYTDKIEEDELKVISIDKIKNNNTMILNTKSKTKIAMLLRWKNRKGVLYPAWQVSLINR